MRVARANAWAEAVLHVLAHVRGGAHVAPSLYDLRWVALAARTLGPASERHLGEDARTLDAVIGEHEALIRAQLVAWLFRSAERVAAARGRDLAALAGADVDAPDLLAEVTRADARGVATVEVVRAAAELELDGIARLPPMREADEALARELDRVLVAAPALGACEVATARPLGIRGRVYDACIWVGAPRDELGVDAEHAAWQAAHEATVHEVARERARGDAGEVDDALRAHRSLERAAIDRLRERARTAGLAEPHARWSARFTVL